MVTTSPYLDANKTAPAESAVEVTPHDSNDIAANCRALWVGGAGDLEVIFVGQSTAVTIVGVAAGTLLPFRVSRVLSTGTTATSIVALY